MTTSEKRLSLVIEDAPRNSVRSAADSAMVGDMRVETFTAMRHVAAPAVGHAVWGAIHEAIKKLEER